MHLDQQVEFNLRTKPCHSLQRGSKTPQRSQSFAWGKLLSKQGSDVRIENQQSASWKELQWKQRGPNEIAPDSQQNCNPSNIHNNSFMNHHTQTSCQNQVNSMCLVRLRSSAASASSLRKSSWQTSPETNAWLRTYYTGQGMDFFLYT